MFTCKIVQNAVESVDYTNNGWFETERSASIKGKLVTEKGEEVGLDAAGRTYRVISELEHAPSGFEYVKVSLQKVATTLLSFAPPLLSHSFKDLLTPDKDIILLVAEDRPPSSSVESTSRIQSIIDLRKKPLPTAGREIVKTDLDAHFKISDIKLLAAKVIGLRNVESDEEVDREIAQGVSYGSSFNLTFITNILETEEFLFSDLPKEIDSEIPARKKRERIDENEKAVLDHIETAINYDLWGSIKVRFGRTKYRDYFDIIKKKVRFLLIDYQPINHYPHDFSVWGNLGRFPKNHIHPKFIKGVLPVLNTQEAKIASLSNKIISDKDEFHEVRSKIVSWYRRKLLEFLRAHHDTFESDKLKLRE
jgi:hypothetical protein